MRRVSILGSPGSGKTTFSKAIAKKYGLTHIELDYVYWLPGWQKPTDDAFVKKLRKHVEETEKQNSNGWVMCGNYTRLLGSSYQQLADTIVLLQLPLWKVVWRVTKRSLRRIASRQEVFPGCQETFRGAFIGSDSLMAWTLRGHATREMKIRQLLREIGKENDLLVFRSNEAATKWLDSQN